MNNKFNFCYNKIGDSMEVYYDLLVNYSNLLSHSSNELELLELEKRLMTIENDNLKKLVQYLKKEKNEVVRMHMIKLNTSKKEMITSSDETLIDDKKSLMEKVDKFYHFPELLDMLPLEEQAYYQKLVDEYATTIEAKKQPTKVYRLETENRFSNRIAGYIDALSLAWISGLVGGSFLTIVLFMLTK